MLVQPNEIIDSKKDGVVAAYRFRPNGIDNTLQRAITELLHSCAMSSEGTRFTLSELGYLHMNTLTHNPNDGCVHLKVYFNAELASRVVRSKTSATATVAPVRELTVFRNFLYVGEDIHDVISFEDIMAPKHSIIDEDEAHRRSIVFKDSEKFEKTHALVINCNVPVTMAAALGLSLNDPNFRVEFRQASDKEKAKTIGITTTREIPVGLTVYATYDPDASDDYDPDDAETYLISLSHSEGRIEENRQRLENKVTKKAKRAKKNKKQIKESKSYGKLC